MSHPDIPNPEINIVPQQSGVPDITPIPDVTLHSGYEDPADTYAPLDEGPVDTSLVGNGREDDEADMCTPQEHGLESEGNKLALPRLTREKIIEDFEQWELGKPVESQASAVGEISDLTDAELETLRSIMPNTT